MIVACMMNASGMRGARIMVGHVVSRGRRWADVFQMNERDVFSHLLAN